MYALARELERLWYNHPLGAPNVKQSFARRRRRWTRYQGNVEPDSRSAFPRDLRSEIMAHHIRTPRPSGAVRTDDSLTYGRVLAALRIARELPGSGTRSGKSGMPVQPRRLARGFRYYLRHPRSKPSDKTQPVSSPVQATRPENAVTAGRGRHRQTYDRRLGFRRCNSKV